MISNLDPIAGKPLVSREACLSLVAQCVRLKLDHAATTVEMESEVVGIQKRYAARLDKLGAAIGDLESLIHDFCVRHRAEMFPDKKSVETPAAVFGFELTPHRVETSSRKITWKDVVQRLLRLSWGKAYVRTPEPQPDKKALLTDREKFTPEQLTAAGIIFALDEQFFIRPKSEILEPTVK